MAEEDTPETSAPAPAAAAPGGGGGARKGVAKLRKATARVKAINKLKAAAPRRISATNWRRINSQPAIHRLVTYWLNYW